MRAVVFRKPGGREVLQLEDIEPGQPDRGEVLVKVTSVGLNRADLLFPQARYFSKPEFPAQKLVQAQSQDTPSSSDFISRLGFEGAGIISCVGEGSVYKQGDRVAFLNFDRVSERGCLAEYAIIPEAKILPTPESVSDELAGSIWVQYLTAWGGLIADGGLKPGQTVTITAASNSVGLACIELAKLQQARVIATTTSDSKFDALYQQGADLVLNLKRSDYVEETNKFTNSEGTDLVFDAIAGPGIRDLIQGSKAQGKIIIQGMLDRRPMDIHAGVLMKRQLTIKGFVIASVLDNPVLLQKATSDIGNGLNSGRLKPLIAQTFTLDNYQQAYQLLESGSHTGKIVILPGKSR